MHGPALPGLNDDVVSHDDEERMPIRKTRHRPKRLYGCHLGTLRYHYRAIGANAIGLWANALPPPKSVQRDRISTAVIHSQPSYQRIYTCTPFPLHGLYRLRLSLKCYNCADYCLSS